jgi:predicted Zn-dependent peptidase
MSGRLFSEIREKYNLAYSVTAYTSHYMCGGQQWYVGVGLDKDKIEQAVELVVKEISRPVGKDELKYATEKLIGEFGLSLDRPATISRMIARAYNNGLDYAELIHNYRQHILTAADHVNEYIEMIDFTKYALVGIVPE